jgi:hypothetical protein
MHRNKDCWCLDLGKSYQVENEIQDCVSKNCYPERFGTKEFY